jgi:hypothetical protein
VVLLKRKNNLVNSMSHVLSIQKYFHEKLE